ncbi:RNA polymerase sigma factor [Dongia sp.]|uniref:RNA polymerase sigma factor n=1 Tax=Dongia sp. TaxID=1977262 RepID=UPI0035B38893
MPSPSLDAAVREAGGRIVAALAVRYRNLDLAEEALAEASLRAARHWPERGLPKDPAAWLYRVAERCLLDALRKRRHETADAPDMADPAPNAEDLLTDDRMLIPDERLRLIFICCHPAVAVDARAALTLKLVCGLATPAIARAFLVSEPTLAQRLVRAKRKIAEAGISFELPAPEHWPERLDAVLTTLEIAYSKAHEDAAGAGPHAGFATEMLDLTRLLADLLPREPDVLALAATIRFAEARRPARLADDGAMIPLAEQDPLDWHRPLIDEARRYLARTDAAAPSPRMLQAQIHGLWCARRSLAEAAPWPQVLQAYDALLAQRDDVVVRLNRAVALAEVAGAEVALAEIDRLDGGALAHFPPYHAVRADLLRRLGQAVAARAAYDAALALDPGPAERLWLSRRRDALQLS